MPRSVPTISPLLEPQTLAGLHGLELRARRIVEGYVAGLHRSPYRGFSNEFAEHREYAPGDDLRYVDWKVFGKSDRFYLKQFEEETNLLCYLLLDTSESMQYQGPHAPLSKFAYAQCAAAALAYLVLHQRDAVGLVTFDDEVRQTIRPSSNPTQLKQLLHVMEESAAKRKTKTGPIFHDLAERLGRRGIVVILSDLFDDVESMLAGLKHLRHRRHDVIVLHLLDPAELDFPFQQVTMFKGLESLGEVIAEPRSLQAAYQREIQAFVKRIRSGCRAHQIDYVMIRTDEPLDAVLRTFLAARRSESDKWIADFGLQIETVQLLAFGFGNLAMLGWLAAAAAPLLIHLWSRHRFREAPWAAMQFLLAAMRKNARRLQLQQWLLLAVRTLIILLVVLAVAEPYGMRLLASGSAGPTHKVIVLDGSYSMAYRAAGETNFAVAKKLAVEMVNAGHAGDAFTVILMAAPPKVIAGSQTFDHAAVAAQIESLAQPQAGADLAATLALINDALADKSGPSKPDHKEVYVLTDLQARTWGDLAKNQQSANAIRPIDLSAMMSSIAKRASTVIVDLSQASASNLAIAELSASSSVVTNGRDVGINATLHNFGAAPHPECRIELLVDEVAVGEQTINAGPGTESAIHFSHRFASAGSHAVTIRTSRDRLELDDTRSLVVPVKSEVRVLCVAGREGATKYLASALNPNPGGDSPIRPVVIAEGDLADTQLADFDCVFLCNVAQLSASEAERLTRYTESGGGIVTFLGDRVLPATYNALLQKGDGKVALPSLVPAAIGPIVAQPQFGLDPLDYRHPIVAPFRGRERAGLLTTPVNRHYRLELTSGRPGVEVAAALPGGDPFIVTAPLGRGRVVLVATDASLSSVDPKNGEAWTTWPTWPSYLPLVRELLAYASGGQPTQWQHLVGAPLAGSIGPATPQSAESGKLQIMRPDGRAVSVALQSIPAGKEWSYADTDISGIYTLRGLPQNETRQFAVNVDTAEGNLAKIDSASLPPEIKVRTTLQGESRGGSLQESTQSDLFTPILWGVLALLFVESFLAWHFGRGAL